MFHNQHISYSVPLHKKLKNKTAMNHRQGTRHLINMDVEVYINNMPVGPGKIHDISNHGAFLKIDPWRLSPHTIVKVIIPVKNQNDKTIIQKGMVIHRSNEGAGLMFLDNQLEAYPFNQLKMG